MPVVSIRHLTTYRYRKQVAFGEHRMMLRPLQAVDQRLVSASVTVSPEPKLLRHIHDVSGACVGVVRFDAPADRLVFESRMRVEHTVVEPFALEDSAARLGAGALYDAEEHPELAASLRRAQEDGEVERWARRFLPANGGLPVSTVLSDMTHAIRAEFAYALRLRGAPQSPAETLSLRSGSCRDFAVLMMDAARSLGIAARFVSGYIYSTSAKSSGDGAGRTGGGHTHAWVRAYVPGCGWVDFDPTNGIVGNLDLIRVAVVADPRLALPLWGSYDGEAADYLGMDVEVELSLVDGAGTQQNRPLRVAQAG
ncbi:MAG: transglutaminase domain protein [Caulobacter sp.]|jgi:transglutaminase-like putative cysteine protease|nr:transglutaminase domain protein [Caulobacter sp.]